MIKPDVVEYGGTEVINKTGEPLTLATPEDVCPELMRKSPQGPAFSKDVVGTSFAAPKVTYIASQIEKIFPNAPALLYRALIAQSAHWPEWAIASEKDKYSEIIRTIGYGIPDVTRATQNNDYRITFITENILETGEGEAHVFRVPIPEELSSVGEDYNTFTRRIFETGGSIDDDGNF
mgnify:CR=1 FL=1